MLAELTILVLGLIALAKSSDFIIRNAVKFSKSGALSMGNLIGADITNISLIFGIVAFIGFKI